MTLSSGSLKNKAFRKYRDLLDVTGVDALDPSYTFYRYQMINYSMYVYKQFLDAGEWTPDKYACNYSEPELPDVYTSLGPVHSQTLTSTIQNTLVASLVQCMAGMYINSFHSWKFVTFIGTCKYCGVSSHKEFQYPKNYKYGYDGVGGTGIDGNYPLSITKK